MPFGKMLIVVARHFPRNVGAILGDEWLRRLVNTGRERNQGHDGEESDSHAATECKVRSLGNRGDVWLVVL